MASAAKQAPERDEAEDEAAAAAKTQPAKKSRGPLLMMIGSALGAAVLASAVTYFVVPKQQKSGHSHAAAEAAKAAKEKEKDEADAAPAEDGDKPPPQKAALYLEFSPAFVVNLADEEAMRFLQINVEIMTRDSTVIDAAKDHMPRIRNALMLLLSQQKAHEIASREAKEALEAKALEEVVAALKAENAPSAVEAVYFTSFVIQ